MKQYITFPLDIFLISFLFQAQQTRMKFLSENMIRVEKEQDETKEPQSEDQQEKTENAETAVEAGNLVTGFFETFALKVCL